MNQGKTVLVVGSGGREHAIAWKLAQSPQVGRLYSAPGNAGMSGLATLVPVAADDIEGQVRLAQEVGADLVVVGPEAPLALGLADDLRRAGIAVVGPGRAAAQLEASKRFAKEVMQAAGVPTASYRTAASQAQASALIREYFGSGGWDGPAGSDQANADGSGASTRAPRAPLSLVVKADGLAAGKGVVICASQAEAEAVAHDMLSGAMLAGAGSRVVLEECLSGPEVSLLTFCDGTHAVPMPLARDYKRLLDGDEGPNTGGMGSVSPVPGCDAELADELLRTCVQPVLAEMARRGAPFRGVLFTGIMLTGDGPRVLEYNARFGDPETQSLMPRLQSDLYEVLYATATGDLAGVQPTWADGTTCCVVIAAPGYPESPARGGVIASLPADDGGIVVFHGGTGRDDTGRLVAAGGRVLSVTATGADLAAARERAYAAVADVHYAGGQYRTDIGETEGTESP